MTPPDLAGFCARCLAAWNGIAAVQAFTRGTMTGPLDPPGFARLQRR